MARHLATTAVVLVAASALSQSSNTNRLTAEADIPAGPATRQLALSLRTPPEQGDQLSILVPGKRFGVALQTPDGRRITRDNAAESAFGWYESPIQAPIGSTDGGHFLTIQFLRAGRAGRYVFELRAEAGSPAARVEATFSSDSAAYADLAQQTEGYAKAGPVTAGPRGGSLKLAVRQAQEGWMPAGRRYSFRFPPAKFASGWETAHGKSRTSGFSTPWITGSAI